MTSIKDPHVIDWFRGAMKEIQTKLVQTSTEITETAINLSQSHRAALRSAVETCSKKCADDDTLLETIQTYEKDLAQKTLIMKEKRDAISRGLRELEQKELQKEDLRLKVEKLREEQAARRDLIVSQNRANKDRLKKLQKAKQVFQEQLGLEIRKTEGEKLQFIFRNIDPANPENAYTFTLGIRADGCYQIMSSDPVVDSLEDLEKKLHQTNNISAFLANIRKEFVSQARI